MSTSNSRVSERDALDEWWEAECAPNRNRIHLTRGPAKIPHSTSEDGVRILEEPCIDSTISSRSRAARPDPPGRPGADAPFSTKR